MDVQRHDASEVSENVYLTQIDTQHVLTSKTGRLGMSSVVVRGVQNYSESILKQQSAIVVEKQLKQLALSDWKDRSAGSYKCLSCVLCSVVFSVVAWRWNTERVYSVCRWQWAGHSELEDRIHIQNGLGQLEEQSGKLDAVQQGEMRSFIFRWE